MIFPQYDGHCGWYEMLENISSFKPLSGDADFETVVIGGGFVGTAAARRLAENMPDKQFLLIEALKIGQGASGRNSGFVIDQPHKRDLELGNNQLKQKIVSLNYAAIDYLEQQINSFDINCQWSSAGKYQASVGPRGEKFLNHYETLLRSSDQPFERLTKSKMRDIFGTEYYSAAIYTSGGKLMQPAALMRGLADNMPANTRIVENTPVLEITRVTGGFRLKTADTEISCRSLILATNVYTAEFGFLKDRILPVMTFASMTRPLTDGEMQLYGGQLDWGLTPADHAGTTLRMTQDRRLIIRNSYRYAHDYNTPTKILPGIQQKHREGFDARYPELNAVPFEHTWGGTSSLSGNFETFFGQLEEGIYTSCCDQSVGAARGTISGMMLADMACNKQSAQLQDMQDISGNPSWLPPKALLKIGVPLRLSLARAASRSEL